MGAERTTQNIAKPVNKLYEMISRYNNYGVFRCSVAFTWCFVSVPDAWSHD